MNVRFEEVLEVAAVQLQRFLPVITSVSLRCLSHRCFQILDANEQFWMAVMDRCGVLGLYRDTVPLPELRDHFLLLLQEETSRWQRCYFTHSKSFKVPASLLISKVPCHRAPKIAQQFGVPHKCKCASAICGCDSPARLVIDAMPNKDPPSRGPLNLGAPRSVQIMDMWGKLHRADHIARAALPSGLSNVTLATSNGSRSIYTLNDGSYVLCWKGGPTPSSTIVSVHLAGTLELPCFKYFTLESKEIVAIGGTSAVDPLALVCTDGSISLLYPHTGEVRQVAQLPDPESPIDLVELSCDGKTLAVKRRFGLAFDVYREKSREEWVLILRGSLPAFDSSPFRVAWDINGLERTQESGFSAVSCQPKKRSNQTTSAQTVDCPLLGEVVCVVSGGILCLPLIDLSDRHDIFPAGAATYFELFKDSAHPAVIEYFPLPEKKAVYQTVSERPADDQAGAAEREGDLKVITATTPAKFMWHYKIGYPLEMFRWRNCWVACVRHVVRLFAVNYFGGGPMLFTVLTGHEGQIYRADVDLDTNRLLTVGKNEIAILWDLSRGKKITSFNLLEFPPPSYNEEDLCGGDAITTDYYGADSVLSIGTTCQAIETITEEAETPHSGTPTPSRIPPPLHTPSLSSPEDFPTLGVQSVPTRNTVWNRNENVRRRGEIETPLSIPEDNEEGVPPIFVELSRALNVPIEQLLADHERQVIWDAAREERPEPVRASTPPPPQVEAKRSAPSRKLITVIAREAAERYDPERRWEQKVLDAKDSKSRRFESKLKIELDIRSVLRELNVRGGCASQVFLAHDNLSIYFRSLNMIQTWCFLDNFSSP